MTRLLSWSIRTRLILLMLAAFLPGMALVLFTERELRDSVTGDAENFALGQVRAMAAHHERVVDNARVLLMALARASEIRELKVRASENLLADMLERNPALAALSLADLHGNVVASAPPGQPGNISPARHFQDALRTVEFVTGHYQLEESPRRVVIHFAQPVLDPAGEPLAVLTAVFDLDTFGSIFASARLPAQSVFTLTDAAGIRLTRFPETEKYTWVRDLDRMVERMSGPQDEGSFLEAGVDGVRRLYAYKRLRLTGAPFPHLMIRLGIPVEQALGRVQRLMVRNLALLGLAAALTLTLTWALAEFTILRRLNLLVTAAGRLGGGDLSARSGLSHQEAELGRLAGAIDAMAEALLKREEERRQAEEAVRTLNEELEARVARRTNQLAQANRDLNQAMEGLRRTQTQLVQTQKMAALGGLVAGVAHEINTPVGIGVTAASHLEEQTREVRALYETGGMKRGDFQRFLDQTAEAARILLGNLNRASELIKSFKSVAVDQTTEERRAFKVREYIETVLVSLHPRLKKTPHRVEVDCDPELTITGYPGALAQILVNFVMNSLLHAFAEDQAGLIRIEVRTQGDTLTLRYFDDGRGMDEKTACQVFEPFFTTARGRGGTGLGLSLVYNLVTSTLGGDIVCESRQGQGTTFTITAPLHQGNDHA